MFVALIANSLSSLLSTDYVHVNLEFPERTGHNLMVIPISWEIKDTKLISGFRIEMVGDYSGAVKNNYKTTLVDKQQVSSIC